jgi:aldose 1-epimerase
MTQHTDPGHCSPVVTAPFGTLPDGRTVTRYTLTNRRGLQAEFIDYGATLVRLLAPDRNGRFADIVLGCATLDEYRRSTSYLGAVIGRCANRIAHGRCTVDGRELTLATNNSPAGIPCHLHGGHTGFDRVLWHAEPIQRAGVPGLRLDYLSPDGEEGYPGNLRVTVHYWLHDDDSLHVHYGAETDRTTPVNLTQHAYFNLRGEGTGDILDHVVTLHAPRVTPVSAGLIPTGEFMEVADTPLDFTTPRRIGDRIDAPHEQLRFAAGYDHNWVLDDRRRDAPRLAAEVFEPLSGRTLEVWTQEPGLQFYTGNFLDGTITGITGRAYGRRSGFCLETQHFPDAPNQPAFPSILLRPGEHHRTATIFRFGAR